MAKNKLFARVNAWLDDETGGLERTMEAAQKEHESFQQAQSAKAEPARAPAPARGPKTVEQQQYTQREYVDSDDVLDAMMKKWQEENSNA